MDISEFCLHKYTRNIPWILFHSVFILIVNSCKPLGLFDWWECSEPLNQNQNQKLFIQRMYREYIDNLITQSTARQETPPPNPGDPGSREIRRVCWSYRPEIWQATRQSCCRDARPISERLEKNLKLESRSPGTPQNPAGQPSAQQKKAQTNFVWRYLLRLICR